MNKSILLIDTPESCRDCVLRGKDMDIDFCGVTGRVIYDEVTDRVISQYCPLRPMPELRPTYPGDGSASAWEARGYNRCVNEILEE